MDTLISTFNLALWVCTLSNGGFALLIVSYSIIFQLRDGQSAKGLFFYVLKMFKEICLFIIHLFTFFKKIIIKDYDFII